MSKSRIIIIGLDGVPFELLSDLADKGVMPHTKALIGAGAFHPMASSIPAVSNVAWSSMITGKNPGYHGIYGFTDITPQTYRMRFPIFCDLRAEPFWQTMEEPSVIVNVPGTYPVKPMNGIHISGFVSIEFEKSVYPRSLAGRLKDLDYRLDVESEKAHESLDLFLKDLDETLAARIKAYELLWDETDWTVFMLVFTGTDRLMHFLWEAYENHSHPLHTQFLDHFRKIDSVIGSIQKKLTDDDAVIMLSDHGFEHLESDIYINYMLKKQKFLRFNAEPKFEYIDKGSRAFALDPARIYLNRKGRYPHGCVDSRDEEKVLRDLEALFKEARVEGKNIIRAILRKEEIYNGPHIDAAPDLVLVSHKGWNLKGSLTAKEFVAKPAFTGKHTEGNAFLFCSGNVAEKIPDKELSIVDVADIIQEVLTVPKAR